MAFTAVTNANFDTALSNFHTASGLVYGPYTRVGTVANTAPNSNIEIEVSPAVGEDFFISYDQLLNTDEAISIVRREQSQPGVNGNLAEVEIALKVLHSNIASFAGPPFSDVEYTRIVEAFRVIPETSGVEVWRSYLESQPLATTKSVANFTVTDNEDGTGTVVNTTPGHVLLALWELYNDAGTAIDQTSVALGYGDGIDFTPAEGDGTFPVTLYVIGPGGISKVTKTLTVTGTA